MTASPAQSGPGGRQRYIVFASKRETAGRVLSLALKNLEAEPEAHVDRVHGTREAPHRLVITASQDAVNRLLRDFKNEIAVERDAPLKMEGRHDDASKTPDAARAGPARNDRKAKE